MGRHIYKNPLPLDRSRIPEPVLDGDPGLVDLYWLAWRQAWDHVTENPAAVQSPYMDEAFDPNIIWIWDTCFMVHFCKYAPDLFPGIQSFDNFYAPMHDGVPAGLKIQHPDNPPLFAWTEYEYARFTGDTGRIRRILPYLTKHYAWWDNARAGATPPYGRVPTALERRPLGFNWNGISSGMDNTPRSRGDYGAILWVDALAQHVLAARHIALLARMVGDGETARAFERKADTDAAVLNEYYWDDEDGLYYDISAQAPYGRVPVRTPASYWPMLAGVCSADQAAVLHAHAADPAFFGGTVPWPSVVRNDPDYLPDGGYWRGASWVPLAYMGTKALERYGYLGAAADSAAAVVAHMLAAYRNYEPHTIWETYHPERPEPARNVRGGVVRPDFCGWSALGPIALLIENVIGIHGVDALEKRVAWRCVRTDRHGIRRLRFGDVETDLVAENGTVTVSSNAPYTLELNGKKCAVAAGEQVYGCA